MNDFGLMVEAQRPGLTRYARHLCRNHVDAEDLVQEAMCVALKAQGRFDGANLGGWLSTILRNLFLSQRGRKHLVFEDADGHHTDSFASTDDIAAACEARSALACLDRLPASYRRALVLTATGASIDEAAAQEGVAGGTIKSRVSRGRVMFMDLIEGRPARIHA